LRSTSKSFSLIETSIRSCWALIGMHPSGRQVGENRLTEPGFRGESPWRSAARVRSSSKARLIQRIKAVCARQRARRADFLESRQEIADNWSQLSVADITYIAIATSFVYLGAILDARLRRVVGYAIGKRIDARWRLPHSGPPSRHADRHRGHPSLRQRFAVRCQITASSCLFAATGCRPFHRRLRK
jgi:hypothetical protein